MSYSEETHAALRQADWRYTRAWHQAMRVFDRASTLAAARAAYNARMAPATPAWKQDYADAVALSEDAF